jgi:hypothetical protein
MANFKVGDRVRIVTDIFPEHTNSEGIVFAIPPESGHKNDCSVLIDGYDARTSGFHYATVCFRFSEIAPLTPPAEDAWAADKVKQVTKPQHVEPVAPEKVTRHEACLSLLEVLRYYDSLHRKPAP